ncbi:MAG TPA: PhoPQ-activated protein PqaA family protein [Desulfomonilia bacterium]
MNPISPLYEQNGFTSHITAYRPISPNGSLIIYHDGHDGYTMSDAVPIQRFLANGYTVWRVDMPLIGNNKEPVWLDLPRIGRVPITQHEEMIFLYDMTTGSPVRYFIEPVIAAVNLAQLKGYKNIFMVGLSGGGWTTTVVAAIDPRITASYPVAGSVPMAMHFDHYKKNWGDWKQVVPDMYHIASYEDLYIMGSYKRSQIQVLNEFDICCFNEPRYVLYEPAIQDVLKSVGGEFDVFWAKGDIIHWACPAAVDRILDDMRLRSK